MWEKLQLERFIFPSYLPSYLDWALFRRGTRWYILQGFYYAFATFCVLRSLLLTSFAQDTAIGILSFLATSVYFHLTDSPPINNNHCNVRKRFLRPLLTWIECCSMRVVNKLEKNVWYWGYRGAPQVFTPLKFVTYSYILYSITNKTGIAL